MECWLLKITWLAYWGLVKDWILNVIMIGVTGAAIWKIIEYKCKTFLFFSEYEKEVLNDLKELRASLERHLIEKPWLGEKSKEERLVNSYKALDMSYLWTKLARDWIHHSPHIKSHTTEEFLAAVNDSIRLIEENGIRKARKIRKKSHKNP